MLSTQDVLCVGRLPEPVPHDGIMNDGRICFSPAGDEAAYDFQLNSGDAWNIKRLLGVLYPRPTSPDEKRPRCLAFP